jgi:hypothetical protein
MRTFTKWSATAALALMILAGAVPGAHAQIANPIFQVPFGVNPYQRIRPNLTALQANYLIASRGQALSFVPPYALGYNPYPSPIVVNPYVPPPLYYGGGGGYTNPYNPYLSPYAGYTNPYTPAGAGAGYGSSATNPYMPGNGYDPYNPYYPYVDPYGGFLRGTADVMRAQSQLMMDQERARLLREQVLQTKMDTRKKALETDLWIKANTPTFTDEQAKIAKTILKRIQTSATPAEIESGKALNVLLDDLRKHMDKKVSVAAMPVDEDVLQHLNVTKSGVGNLGLLRNEGQLTWPKVLRDLATPAELKEIEAQAVRVVPRAAEGKIDENVLSELKTNVGKLRAQLGNKFNELPTSQYMEGKRFLNSFEDALLALQQGDAPDYFNFRNYVRSHKNLQDVVNFMVDRGLRFAPAVAGDEGAYVAMHTALAAYDVAVNTQDVASNKQ